jgi:K+-transporting ATPase ATPase C chain
MRRLLLTSLRIIIVMTVLCGVIYPLFILGIAQLASPAKANGSIISINGKAVGSSLLGQSFTDASGNPLPQYFQTRPADPGYDYNADGSGSDNYGPSNPLLIGFVPGISIVNTKGELVDGPNGKPLPANPFAVPGDPTCVPESSTTGNAPIAELPTGIFTGPGNPSQYLMANGTYVCDPNTVAERAIAYRQLNDLAPTAVVPVDAVTASFSGLDPDISIANADLQAPRVARVRHLPLATVDALVNKYTSPRPLDILGEPGVNVLKLNIALNQLPRT